MLWSGRFSKPLNKRILDFTSSLELDKRLYEYDIKGSIAHVNSLQKAKVVTSSEFKKIVSALKKIRVEFNKNLFCFNAQDEDIHMAIERRLIELCGDTGKKLHTGRSRNDQVALDMRMYLKDVVGCVLKELNVFKKSLTDTAKENISIVMPGYTHLQQAQPVLFSHYVLAYASILDRDIDRFKDMLKRLDVMPLGSGALAGTPYEINRRAVANELGFSKISINSMDAVSDRDFIIDFLSASAVFAMHCSRLAEDLIIYSSQEFSFVEMDDSFATGSSIMPQKKNPDVLELTRGKSERVIGALNSFLNVMKALPLTYNRDLQEDKYYLFSTVDVVLDFLCILPKVILSMKIKKNNMRKALDNGYLYATGIADYLVAHKVPFREAHRITGQIVIYAINKNKTFMELKLDEFKQFSNVFKKDIFGVFDPKKLIDAQKIEGGTSTKSVKTQLKKY
ncbi:MAG: argininosuccinate lyase [Elusimicrobiota bacterium]